MPLDLLASEQARITRELEHPASTEQITKRLSDALDYLTKIQVPYLHPRATPTIRRRITQSFFTRIVVGEDDRTIGRRTKPTPS